MALIKSQLVLTDGMTGPLKSINKAMNIVLNSFEAMQDASGRAIDTASISNGFCFVHSNGGAYLNVASYTGGVCFGFCV